MTYPDSLLRGLVFTFIQLGQQTLSALKLVDWPTYHAANEASHTWLKNLMIERLERLEQIREIPLDPANKTHGPREAAVARQIYSLISQHELRVIRYYQRKSEGAARCYRHRHAAKEGIEEVPEPEAQDCLEKQLVVCFGKADKDTSDILAKGLPRGIQGMYGSLAVWMREEECFLCEKYEDKGKDLGCHYYSYPGSSLYFWQTEALLQDFEPDQKETDWWRPYRLQRAQGKVNIGASFEDFLLI